jgi:hypothetical protein
MPEYIRLLEGELAECRQYAERMQERHKNTPQGWSVHKGQDRLNRDWIAKASEAAVAQYLGIPISFQINAGPGGDSGFDLAMTLADGTPITIDVKHSSHPKAQRLIWPLGKKMDNMATVLAFVVSAQINSEGWGVFQLHGWITSFQFRQFCQEAPPGDSLKEKTNFMSAYGLTPMKYLKNN